MLMVPWSKAAQSVLAYVLGERQYLGCCSAPLSVGVYALVSGHAVCTVWFVGVRLIGLVQCVRAGT